MFLWKHYEKQPKTAAQKHVLSTMRRKSSGKVRRGLEDADFLILNTLKNMIYHT